MSRASTCHGDDQGVAVRRNCNIPGGAERLRTPVATTPVVTALRAIASQCCDCACLQVDAPAHSLTLLKRNTGAVDSVHDVQQLCKKLFRYLTDT